MSDNQKIGVYILKSQKNTRFYIGSTNNLKRRLEEHQNGRVKSTKHLLPIKLVFFKPYKTVIEARKIEYKIKRLKRKDYLEKIVKNNRILIQA